ncbi:MAG: hypothetical protein ABIY70_21380 [Capsulimonas sp.]|uniref:hypothetical protein n=1 Tax=Capsulimonas sp. TaxID=2494211 RepID=UPI003263A69E
MDDVEKTLSTSTNVPAEDNSPLEAAMAELARHDAAVRDAILKQLREQSEYMMASGLKTMEASRSAQAKPSVKDEKSEPMSNVKMALGLGVSLLMFSGFVALCWAIIAGVPHPVASGGQDADGWGLVWSDSHGWRVAQYAWCGFLTWLLARNLRRGLLTDAWAVVRQLTFPILFQNLLIVLVTATAALTLLHLFPALNRSWLYLIPGGHGSATNLSVLPAHIKYYGIAFLLLFAVSIPKFARSEEKSYREGTRNWKQGAWRSLRFGLGHCVVGVPLYAGLALTIGGLWFTLQYFRGGVERSTLHHAAYNWVITAAALVGVTLWSLH